MGRFRLCYIVVILLVTISQAGPEPFPWHEYPEVQGLDFCATRLVADGRCCAGRNDSCSVPMLDAVCYCDMFCDRTEPDCCPDFVNSCMGGGRTIEAHKAAQLKYAGTKMIDNNCFHEGSKYFPGNQITFNCNNCTCVYAVVTEEYNWECTQKVCLVRTSVIHRVNEGAFGWRAQNYTFLWGASLEDGVAYRLGTERPLISLTQVAELKVKEGDTIPVEFDARKKWPGLITDIMDQGMCAASYAFSATSVASDRLAIHSGGRQKVALAPQQLVSCNTQGQKGCQGGHVDRAWWYMRSYGLVSNDCYPYRSGKSGVQESCIIPSYRTRNNKVRCASRSQDWSRVYRVTPPYRIAPIEKEIMKEIMDNGPVQATMTVEEDFYLYNGGVYQDSMPAKIQPPNRRKAGYHSVKIIGWGVDTSNGKPIKYWLCANSWGPDWGENGYFRIVRGANEAEIESFILAAWASVRNRRAINEGYIYTPTPGENRAKRSTESQEFNPYLTSLKIHSFDDTENSIKESQYDVANLQKNDPNGLFDKNTNVGESVNNGGKLNNELAISSGDTQVKSFNKTMQGTIKTTKTFINVSRLNDNKEVDESPSKTSTLSQPVSVYSREAASTDSNHVIEENTRQQPADESVSDQSKHHVVETTKEDATHSDSMKNDETLSHTRTKEPH